MKSVRYEIWACEVFLRLFFTSFIMPFHDFVVGALSFLDYLFLNPITILCH